MAYATIQDLEARWRTLSEDEQAQASILLDDAAAMLASFVCVDNADENLLYLLKVVSCSMVKRSLMAGESTPIGVDQFSATMGPFGQIAHFSNPSGDMYISAQERRLLGIGSDYMTSIRSKVGGFYA